MEIIFAIAFGTVALFATLTFIGFAGSVAATIYLQNFSGDETKTTKALKWNQRFNFIKSLFWQWTVYLFAFVSAAYFLF